MNLENYSLWLVTWRFCMTHEEPEILTDIRDFTALFYTILRRKSSEWLESSTGSDLGCVPLGWSGSGSVIQDHLDHGASKEPMNPLWSRIHRFLWWTMIWVILDHWSWSRSPQRNASLGMRFSMGNLDLAICDFAFFEHCFLCKNRLLKRESYLVILVIHEKKFLFSWSVILYFFRLWTAPETPPCTTLTEQC